MYIILCFANVLLFMKFFFSHSLSHIFLKDWEKKYKCLIRSFKEQ